ncbi:hypothetical protein LCGC14_2663570, partial [marine sediment metagenome]
MRDLFNWLVSGNSGKKSNREHLINLKMVNRRLNKSMKKLENTERQTERKIRQA